MQTRILPSNGITDLLMTIELVGNWKKDFAYDVHTLSSVYLGPDEFGHDQWDNTRSEMGELLYQLKYRHDKAAVGRIVDLLDRFKGTGKFDAIIPVPATRRNRPFQPVDEIALELGRRRDVAVLVGLLTKRAGGPELKDVVDPEARQELLRELIFLNMDRDVSGKNVLLLDDLYRSGATLSIVTNLLYEEARVNTVCVLTMTKNRSRK